MAKEEFISLQRRVNACRKCSKEFKMAEKVYIIPYGSYYRIYCESCGKGRFD